MTAVNTSLPPTTTNTTTTTNTSNAAGSSSASGTSGTSQKSLNTDFQQFLTLLTTQLQNQDPTAPMDTNEITQQVAMLSQVQQQINTNTQLQNLVSLYTNTQATSAAGYIGKQIDATGNQIELSGSSSTTAGTATMVYNMPSGATAATVTIKDSKGNTVYTGDAPTTTGRNQLAWNGVGTDGTSEPNGTYSFSIVAKDSTGKTIKPGPSTFTTGVVTAVETVDGVNSLSLGDVSVPLTSVNAVYTAGTNPGA